MALRDYYTCNCCLYQQELTAMQFQGTILGIPPDEKENYINCHFRLNETVKDNEPEFNIKHRDSTGCGCWTCGICGSSSKAGHAGCWDRCCK